MKLIEEIERRPELFGEINAVKLAAVVDPELADLLSRKNGALALSGALVFFGVGDDPAHPVDRRCYQAWEGREDYGLSPADEVFGVDIFGDLLFANGGEAFRLDGELGDRVPLGRLTSWLGQDRSDAAEELGGRLARERFGGRVIGEDPLRMLPTFPFMMKEFVPGEFFETPLSRAIGLKLRLFRLCQNAPEGTGMDCSFWRA